MLELTTEKKGQTMNPDINECVNQYIKLNHQMAELKAKLDILAEVIKQEGEKQYITKKGILSVIYTSATKIFDSARFKKECPKIAEQYEKEKAGYLSIRIK